jgi:hypothetical protein
MVWKDPFKGVSTEAIRETDIESLNTWDRRTIARAVRRLADTANKRIKKFEEKGLESPAYLNVQKSGGKFSTRGKTVNQLRTEFIRARNFLGMKTATIKGYEKVKTDFFDRVEATTGQRMVLDDDDLNKFWRLYDQMESDVAPFVKGSPQGQKVVFDIFIDNLEESQEELIKIVKKKFDIYYEEQQEEQRQLEETIYTSIFGNKGNE